jgi:hypothetical protein
MPGRFGDILWALPTMRAIAEVYDQPVEFLTSATYEAIRPLLDQQSYIDCTGFDPGWIVQETAPITPTVPPGSSVYAADVASDPHYYDAVYHLGYEGWPSPNLPRDIYDRAFRQYGAHRYPFPPLDLDRPWITVSDPEAPCEIAIGFTDEHFELKYGIATLLDLPASAVLAPTRSRWAREFVPAVVSLYVCGWQSAAGIIRNSDVFLGCCSALHVLACALGKPVVLMEPNPQRHHTVFYPYGTEGRVHLVRGLDGQPTFDVRHVRSAIQDALGRRA